MLADNEIRSLILRWYPDGNLPEYHILLERFRIYLAINSLRNDSSWSWDMVSEFVPKEPEPSNKKPRYD